MPTPSADLGSDVDIRPACSEADRDALINELGQCQYFIDRWERHKKGLGRLLIVWLGSRPVGDAYLWLEDAEEPEIFKYLPNVPLLTHLEIHHAYRRQGLGTRLIAYAEQELVRLRCAQVALAVEETNDLAIKLYERLGYQDWKRGVVKCEPFDDDGSPQPVEICHVMVKTLAPIRPSRVRRMLSHVRTRIVRLQRRSTAAADRSAVV